MLDRNAKFIFELLALFRLPKSSKKYTKYGVSHNIFQRYGIKKHKNIGDDCAFVLKKVILEEIKNNVQKKDDLYCYLAQYLNREEKTYFIDNADDIDTMLTYVMSKFTHPHNEEFKLDLDIPKCCVTLETFKEKLVKSMMLERLSLSLSIDNNDDDIVDEHHHYRKIKRIDFIDYDNNQYSSYRWLTIENISDKPTTFIRHLECGENKIHFNNMRVRAFENNYLGKSLLVDSLHLNQPSFIQKIQINFAKPLKPGYTTTIFYRLDWPDELSAFSYENLNHSITLTRYLNKISRLEFGILEKFDIVGVTAIKIKSNYIQENVAESPIYFNCTDEMDLKPIHNKNLHGFYYKFDNPDGIAYRFMYRHEDKNNTLENDFF